MRWLNTAFLVSLLAGSSLAQSVDGLYSLVQRRIPAHADNFRFSLVATNSTSGQSYDQYVVSTLKNGSVLVEGNTLSALASGLHRYMADVAHVDLWWYIGNRMDAAPSQLPSLQEPIQGSSVVPWRYHFNTVTFSYTSAFWTWEDWELQLDWMALRGINLPLAWVGYEKVLSDVFREIGLTDAEIATFLSGPAFQAWNRFGNIQGSWDGDLPQQWINAQFELQKKIVARMVELGMTPVLPAFTGFVPRDITRVLPNASVVNGSQWGGFPTEYTNVSFLEPFDENFAKIQKSFISKQQEYYGNVTHIYTLDQYNENDPYSGDEGYLRNITRTTWQSLKAADPEAIWLMQGWLFFSDSKFWTNDRVEAYLSGVEKNSDMLILDLFSESQPQWQRTNSYFGKPWIWCQLHDYGGNMGMYGQIQNITVNPVEALANSSSLVGYGLTMEGQEGNEIVYDLLLDQAWSKQPIDTKQYFHDWVTARYSGGSDKALPQGLYQAWEALRTTVYDNTNSTVQAVIKPILVLEPSTSGLLGRTGHHATTLTYDPAVVVKAWHLMYSAAQEDASLWNNPAYSYDMVDITRQVLANAFIPQYEKLIATYEGSNASASALASAGQDMIRLLHSLDDVLATNDNFQLSSWVDRAISWAQGNKTLASYYKYNARNQITLWGPTGQISDYASKQWSGLVSSYYVPRWQTFVKYLESTSATAYNKTALHEELLDFELKWQYENAGDQATRQGEDLQTVLKQVQTEWPSVFSA